MATVLPPGRPANSSGGFPVEKKTGGLIGKLVTKLTGNKGVAKIESAMKAVKNAPQPQASGDIKDKLKAATTVQGESIGLREEDLEEALAKNDPALIRKLLQNMTVGELLKTKVQGTNNLLQLACMRGKDEIVKALLEKATVADLTTKDKDGRTALHYVFATAYLHDEEATRASVGHFAEFCSHDAGTRYKELFLAQDQDKKTPLDLATGNSGKAIASEFTKGHKMWL